MAKSRMMDFLVRLATDPEARRRYGSDEERETLFNEAKLSRREVDAIRSQDAKKVKDTFGTQAATAQNARRRKGTRKGTAKKRAAKSPRSRKNR